MSPIARKADGRRIFTDQFKREQLGRVSRGELSLAELSRKLGIARSLLQRWKRLLSVGGERTSVARMRAGSGIALGPAEYLRELQLVVGKQTVELELLRSELERIRASRRSTRTPGG